MLKVSRSRILFLVAFALACGACRAEGPRARPGKSGGDQPAKKPPILIYSDMSPGAYLHASTWKMVGESTGEGAVLTTDPAEFTTRLAGGRFDPIIVAARYTDGEPAYAAALRNYLAAHPRADVYLFIWHDNGTEPPADSIMSATMSMFVWFHEMTTVFYANAVYGPSTTSDDRKPHTVHGSYLWPDFASIGTKDPEILTQQTKLHAATQAGDDCYEKCYLKYLNRILDCFEQNDEDEDECLILYGPSEQSPGHPKKFVKCLSDAKDDFVNCVERAERKLNYCLELCEREEQGVQSPSE
ncbi:MAG: hypothetical protein KAY37_10990 [Phycisphaerae bacterium]|nr:hypothetical protein [Phycisphaerae bacterium]